MDLKEKLASLDRYSTSVNIRHQTIPTPTPNTVLDGEEINTKFGPCWRIQYRFDLSDQHGSYRIGDLLENDSTPLKFIAKSHGYENINLESLLFIDTETTGLSGGVGTVAFLIGTGYFKDNQFIIDQFFIRNFSEETAMLSEVQNQVTKAINGDGAVVSFNGKSYDLPLILNRMIFNRIHPPGDFKHIDILHTARRIWKSALIDCSLTNVEANILNYNRLDDVPGFMIPEIYFQYLRDNNPDNLNQVFLHNKLDILTLVGLLHEMIQLYAGNRAFNEKQVDWLNLCRAFDEMQAYNDGLAFYTKLADLDWENENRSETYMRIAAIHKRCERIDDAIKYWSDAIELDSRCLKGYEELAKAYEHQLGDFSKAKRFTEDALQTIEIIDKFRSNGFDEEIKKDFLHRLERLNQRLKRE